MHFFIFVLPDRFGDVREFFVDLGQELFCADREGLDLKFFDDQCDRLVSMPTLDVKYAFSSRPNGICREVFNWIEIHIYPRHIGSNKRPHLLRLARSDLGSIPNSITK